MCSTPEKSKNQGLSTKKMWLGGGACINFRQYDMESPFEIRNDSKAICFLNLLVACFFAVIRFLWHHMPVLTLTPQFWLGYKMPLKKQQDRCNVNWLLVVSVVLGIFPEVIANTPDLIGGSWYNFRMPQLLTDSKKQGLSEACKNQTANVRIKDWNKGMSDILLVLKKSF